MERVTEYKPTRVSHPVESLVEFLEMYPGVPINETFWRKRVDDYVASVVQLSVLGEAATTDAASIVRIATALVHPTHLSDDDREKAIDNALEICDQRDNQLRRAAKTKAGFA